MCVSLKSWNTTNNVDFVYSNSYSQKEKGMGKKQKINKKNIYFFVVFGFSFSFFSKELFMDAHLDI